MALSLLDLPNELLTEIILLLHSSVDLFALIRTSRYFRQLFQAIGPSIIRQRFGGQVGLCAAVTSFRLGFAVAIIKKAARIGVNAGAVYTRVFWLTTWRRYFTMKSSDS